MLVEMDALELGEDRVADRLRGNTSGVGDEENRTLHADVHSPEGGLPGTLAHAPKPVFA
jgi:hypothetical protein